MAKARRWSVAEAYAALNDPNDKTRAEARGDIAHRYPLFATASRDELMAVWHDSLRTIEARLREAVLPDDGEDVVEAAAPDQDEAPEPKAEAKEEPKADAPKKRKRRTKAQIQADNEAAEEAAKKQDEKAGGDEDLEDLFDD